MKLYGGIDLHSNNSVVVVVLDEEDRVIYEKRLPNDLGYLLLERDTGVSPVFWPEERPIDAYSSSRWGRRGAAVGSASAQVLTDPASVVPMVGASGAIGGIMGAYARLYPRAHVHTVVALGLYFTTVSVPALFMLGYWFLFQILAGIPALRGACAGIAFWAHVGGFLGGMWLVGPFHRPELLAAHRAQRVQRTARHHF